jgi:hypothetical protein
MDIIGPDRDHEGSRHTDSVVTQKYLSVYTECYGAGAPKVGF